MECDHKLRVWKNWRIHGGFLPAPLPACPLPPAQEAHGAQTCDGVLLELNLCTWNSQGLIIPVRIEQPPALREQPWLITWHNGQHDWGSGLMQGQFAQCLGPESNINGLPSNSACKCMRLLCPIPRSRLHAPMCSIMRLVSLIPHCPAILFPLPTFWSHVHPPTLCCCCAWFSGAIPFLTIAYIHA